MEVGLAYHSRRILTLPMLHVPLYLVAELSRAMPLRPARARPESTANCSNEGRLKADAPAAEARAREVDSFMVTGSGGWLACG